MIAQSHSVLHSCVYHTGLTLRAGYTVVHTHAAHQFSLHSRLLGRSKAFPVTPLINPLLWGSWVSVWVFFRRRHEVFFCSIKEQRCLISGKYFWIIIIILVDYFPPTIFLCPLSHLCSFSNLLLCICSRAVLTVFRSFPSSLSFVLLYFVDLRFTLPSKLTKL